MPGDELRLTDGYGGSTVNRARFLCEVVETVLKYVESGNGLCIRTKGVSIGLKRIDHPYTGVVLILGKIFAVDFRAARGSCRLND